MLEEKKLKEVSKTITKKTNEAHSHTKWARYSSNQKPKPHLKEHKGSEEKSKR